MKGPVEQCRAPIWHKLHIARQNMCSTASKHVALRARWWNVKSVHVLIVVKQQNNHLCVIKHAQIRVHAQGFGSMAGVFVKLCCLVEFPLVGHDVCQEQLVFVLTLLLPLLRINQHKHQHVWMDKYSVHKSIVSTHRMRQMRWTVKRAGCSGDNLTDRILLLP